MTKHTTMLLAAVDRAKSRTDCGESTDRVTLESYSEGQLQERVPPEVIMNNTESGLLDVK